MAVQSITSSGDGSFVALSETMLVECWGPCGNVSGSSGGKGAPGAGAYAKKTLTGLTVGQSYSYHVGAPGEDTWFQSSATVKAVTGGDAAASGTAGGTGGLAANCIGDVCHSGGNGGNGHVTGKGGGGGSSAGPDSDGNSGTNATTVAAGVGGAAVTDGGSGGNGGNLSVGADGGSPGGAPGGGASTLSSGATSVGKIRLTYTPGLSTQKKAFATCIVPFAARTVNRFRRFAR